MASTYDLALYPAPGPGLGHLMRCYALAEWAAGLKAMALVVLEEPTPSITWPCAVLRKGTPYQDAGDARVRIVDGPERNPVPSGGPLGDPLPRRYLSSWHIVDALPDGEDPLGYIYPHFGAEPVPGVPTFAGPQWMPLRKRFSVRYSWGGAWASYRTDNLECRPADDDWPRWAGGMLAPPSTIAYEAMARGIPVALHDEHEIDERITDAMVAAGAAVRGWADRDRVRPHELVDGLGAKRLLEALL